MYYFTSDLHRSVSPKSTFQNSKLNLFFSQRPFQFPLVLSENLTDLNNILSWDRKRDISARPCSNFLYVSIIEKLLIGCLLTKRLCPKATEKHAAIQFSFLLFYYMDARVSMRYIQKLVTPHPKRILYLNF